MREDGKTCMQTVRDIIGEEAYNEYGGFGNFGENIAYGYGTPAAVMEAWKSSSGHYSSMIDKEFKCGAIAVYCKDVTLYWSANFSESIIE